NLEGAGRVVAGAPVVPRGHDVQGPASGVGAVALLVQGEGRRTDLGRLAVLQGAGRGPATTARAGGGGEGARTGGRGEDTVEEGRERPRAGRRNSPGGYRVKEEKQEKAAKPARSPAHWKYPFTSTMSWTLPAPKTTAVAATLPVPVRARLKMALFDRVCPWE